MPCRVHAGWRWEDCGKQGSEVKAESKRKGMDQVSLTAVGGVCGRCDLCSQTEL